MYHVLASDLSGTTDPTGVITPSYVGQLYVNTSNNKVFAAKGTSNTDWLLLNARGITDFSGLESNYVLNTTIASNNTTTLSDYTSVSLTLPAARSGSIHKLEACVDWSCTWDTFWSSNEAIFALYEGTTELASWNIRYLGNPGSVYPIHLWHMVQDMTQGTHTYTLKYRSSYAGYIVTIHRAGIGISAKK